MTTIIETPSDLQWLKDVHGAPESTKFALLFGNEDAPTKVECWNRIDPMYDQPPDAWIVDGKLGMRIFLAGWGDDMERLGVRQRTFGHLVRLALPYIEHYHSDLYHDAKWLEKYLTPGEPFYYGVDAWGTDIGTDRNLVEAFNRENLWKITVENKNGGAWYITIERVR